MNFIKSIVFFFCFGVIVSSCETNEPAVISKEVKPEKIIFDSRFVEDLTGNFKLLLKMLWVLVNNSL